MMFSRGWRDGACLLLPGLAWCVCESCGHSWRLGPSVPLKLESFFLIRAMVPRLEYSRAVQREFEYGFLSPISKDPDLGTTGVGPGSQ